LLFFGLVANKHLGIFLH